VKKQKGKDRCPICHKKLKFCKGHKKPIPIWPLLIMLVILAISILGLVLGTLTYPISEVLPMTNSPADKTIKNIRFDINSDSDNEFLGRFLVNDEIPEWLLATPMNQELLEQMTIRCINPLVQEIFDSYPIDSLRSDFKKAWRDPEVTKTFTWLTGIEEWQTAPVARVERGKYDHNRAVIVFTGEKIREEMLLASVEFSPLKALESFKDTFIAVYLHEYFHATKQSLWKNLDRTYEDLLEAEKECWAYTVTDVLQIMKANGRGDFMPLTIQANIMVEYNHLKGDINDPDWHNFINQLISN
jgi:hypothetical protein